MVHSVVGHMKDLTTISIAVSVYGHGEQEVFQSHEQILVAFIWNTHFSIVFTVYV